MVPDSALGSIGPVAIRLMLCVALSKKVMVYSL